MPTSDNPSNVFAPSKRSQNISRFQALDILAEANAMKRDGIDVVRLEAGQPGNPAPGHVIETAQKHLAGGKLGYTEATGIPDLKQALAVYYQNRYQQTVAPKQILVTTGSSAAFILSFLACFEAGDKVAIAAPGYPAYRNILRGLGLEVVEIPTDESTNFQPTPALLDKTASKHGKLAGLLVASPSNPTGSVLKDDELSALTEWCTNHGVRLIADELYQGITYGDPAPTLLKHNPEAIVINSFSKFFTLTGWRLGWMVVPENMIAPIKALAQNLYVAPPTLPQYAGIAALESLQEFDAMVTEYQANRDLLCASLPACGFEIPIIPEGAYYLYAYLPQAALDRGEDSMQFCRRMLHEAHVSATPGIDFDTVRGPKSLRFSFAGTHSDIERAVKRLTEWLA